MSAEVHLHVRRDRVEGLQKALRAWIKSAKEWNSGGSGKPPVLIIQDTLLEGTETRFRGPTSNGSPTRAVPN